MLDTIIEPICIGCKEERSEKFGLCSECLSPVLNYQVDNRCKICSLAIVGEGTICERCLNNEYLFDRGLYMFPYTDAARTLIHYIKFKDKKEWLEILGMIDREALLKLAESCHCVTYIPSSVFSYFSRGYNVSEEIGKWVAQVSSLPLVKMLKPGKLFKKRLSLTKTIGERRKIVRHFLKAADFKGKNLNVLLVDDVFTTGSTLNEASRILKKSGQVKQVHVFTLARVE